jgi:hypothetical protein
MVDLPVLSVLTMVAEPLGRRSKFSRDVGGPLVGGVDIMMSSDPRSVVHLACSPLLHYAFRVAKLRVIEVVALSRWKPV